MLVVGCDGAMGDMTHGPTLRTLAARSCAGPLSHSRHYSVTVGRKTSAPSWLSPGQKLRRAALLAEPEPSLVTRDLPGFLSQARWNTSQFHSTPLIPLCFVWTSPQRKLSLNGQRENIFVRDVIVVQKFVTSAALFVLQFRHLRVFIRL